MALTDKLTAIADGFRASRGTTAKLSLDEMAALAAESTGVEQNLKASDYPDYVRTETVRVANAVRTVLKDESIVSICLSDSHFPADTNTRNSGIHAMMAIKSLTYLLPVDFIAHLGDVGFEGNTTSTTTIDVLEDNLTEMLGYVKESAGDSVPLFVAIGNHDSGNYITTSDNSDMLSGEYLYNNFTALSASENTVFSGEANGGYCYRDFPNKKIRVFLLNTSEEIITGGYSNDNGTSVTQRAWVASQLQELNTKSDAAEWGIVVLCHYPADYGAARPLSNLFAAYVNGTSITLSETAYDFSGANSARFIVQHHGHIHNFLADKLYTGDTPTQYNAWRVGIPNTQDNRENYYGEFNGIQYSETDTYDKRAGTVEDTSFVVNVINPSEEKIYSFYYGRGRNRTIGYGDIVYHSVSKTFSKVTSDNSIYSVEDGQSYTEVLTLDAGCEIQKISVVMGTQDLTATAVTAIENGYSIYIQNVTDDITIVAKAQATPDFTNLVPLSVDTEGIDYNVDGDGYKNGIYIGSNGSEVELAGYTTTGYIPVALGAKTIRIAGDGVSIDSEYTRICFFNNDFSKLSVKPYKNMGGGTYNGTLLEEDSSLVAYSIDDYYMVHYAACPYIRICTKGDGAGLIVTVDEPITYGTNAEGPTVNHVINYSGNIVSSNSSEVVQDGASFSATLSGSVGYDIDTVKVTMGGVDVTSTTYDSSTREVTISNVTGNVIIFATTIKVAVNLLSYAVDSDGTTIYNDIGYKTGVRLSTSDGGERTNSGMAASGWIAWDPSTEVLVLENIGTDTVSYTDSMIIGYTATSGTSFTSICTGDLNLTTEITPESDGTILLTKDKLIAASMNSEGTKYIRISSSYIGTDSKVYVQE